MKLEGVDTRSEMVNIQKFLQRNSNSVPLIPPGLFDLEWYHGCKLSAKPPWHQRTPVTLPLRRVPQEHGGLKIATAVIIQTKQTNKAEVQKNVNKQRVFQDDVRAGVL